MAESKTKENPTKADAATDTDVIDTLGTTNDVRQWRNIIADYELTVDKKHPKFKSLSDFFNHYGTNSTVFYKSYDKFSKSMQDDPWLKKRKEELALEEPAEIPDEEPKEAIDTLADLAPTPPKKPISNAALAASAIFLTILAIGGLYGYDIYERLQQEDEVVRIQKVRDNEDWVMASRRNDATSYRAYLEEWPNGEWADFAREQIARIEKEALERADAAEKKRLKLLAMQRKLAQMGYSVRENGKMDTYTTIALAQLQGEVGLPVTGEISPDLDTTIDSELNRRDDEAWQLALDSGSEAALVAYSHAWPMGKYLDRVSKAIKAMRSNDPNAIQAVKASQKPSGPVIASPEEQIMFGNANEANTAAAYLAYLERFPNGKYAQEASEGFNRLLAEQAGMEKERQLISDVQTELLRLKYRNIQVSGYDGSSTKAAIRLFQRATGRAEDGKITRALLGLLQATPRRPNILEGETFTDCALCPEMVLLPAGSFEMGSEVGDDEERPVHSVTIERPFAMGKYEVTIMEYQSCVISDACPVPEWEDMTSDYNRYTGSLSSYFTNMGDSISSGTYPIIGVSWEGAQAYAKWLTQETGKTYRLPSEAEWEYAASSGASTAYAFGETLLPTQGNYAEIEQTDNSPYTTQVGTTVPNAFDLYDMHGNVWEWVEDCWTNTYDTASIIGRPMIIDGCTDRVIRGGSWNNLKEDLRSARRKQLKFNTKTNEVGFRLVRELSEASN